MKLDFARVSKSEEPTLEKLVGAIELSDQDLAGVVGGDGWHGRREKHYKRREKHYERQEKHYGR